MATSGSYYLNGPSLTSSTAVFTDSGLTTLAPDGFYSDGVILREQLDGVLLPAVPCGSCEPVCLEYLAIAEVESGSVEYTDCAGVPQIMEVLEGVDESFCAFSNTVVPSEGVVIIEIGYCIEFCRTYGAQSTVEGVGGTVTYRDCNGIIQTDTVPDTGEPIYFCSSSEPGEITTTGPVDRNLVNSVCIL